MNLATTFLRTKADATVEPLEVNAAFWSKLAAGELGSFQGENLVSLHSASGDWNVWEMHPNGDEIVCLISGAVTFVLDEETGPREVRLVEPGDVVVIPKSTWHTAKDAVEASALFITPGEGTQHRSVER